MNPGLRLFLYVLVTAGCVAVLVGGVQWLITPDPALAAAARGRPAPIPPRMMESIERKVPLPVQQPERAPSLLPPELRTAPVSLTAPKLIEPPKIGAVKVMRGSRNKHKLPTTETYVASATPTVVTERTQTGF